MKIVESPAYLNMSMHISNPGSRVKVMTKFVNPPFNNRGKETKEDSKYAAGRFRRVSRGWLCFPMLYMSNLE
jgi:hypothetical protein